MRVPNAFFYCLSLCCLLLANAFVTQQPTWAFNDEICARLFEAHPDVKVLQIAGQFKLLHAINERFPDGVYNLRPSSSPGCVEIDRGGTRICRAQTIKIAG